MHECTVLPLERHGFFVFFFQCQNLELHLVSQILSCEMKVIIENIKLGTLNWILIGLQKQLFFSTSFVTFSCGCVSTR